MPDMEHRTAAELVAELVLSFEAGLQLYSQWRRRRERANHYRKPAAAANTTAAAGTKTGTSNCALSTSFSIASRVQEAYDVGFAILGAEFATGDSPSRRILHGQLAQIREQVAVLLNAASAVAGPLDIKVILQVSETARIASIQALADLYQRLAIGRPVPGELPVPKWRSSSREGFSGSPAPSPVPVLPPPPPPPPPEAKLPAHFEDDALTAIWSAASGPLVFQSEPPSPPLTPKLPDELESVAGTAVTTTTSTTKASSRRPKNSVFNIFCPDAMALQVDVSRPLPASRRCRCGFRWRVPREDLPDDRPSVLLKDGFAMTRRFLAKSHREGARAGYGCVLCTSSGLAQTFETAEHLRAHVNAAHSKWQMLHDRDMT